MTHCTHLVGTDYIYIVVKENGTRPDDGQEYVHSNKQNEFIGSITLIFFILEKNCVQEDKSTK